MHMLGMYSLICQDFGDTKLVKNWIGLQRISLASRTGSPENTTQPSKPKGNVLKIDQRSGKH
jgi:hypothetical protein